MSVHNEWSKEPNTEIASGVQEISRAKKLAGEGGGQLRISDPLLLESLCLLGVGIAAACVTLVVAEVLRSACSIRIYFEPIDYQPDDQWRSEIFKEG